MKSGGEGTDSFGMESEGWMGHLAGVDERVEAVSERIRRISRLLGLVLKDTASRHGITIGDWESLSVLQRSGVNRESTQKELADKLGVTSGTISVRVDRLMRAELIEPGATQEDGRNRPVRLTDRGSKLWRKATEERTTREDELYTGSLDVEELETLNLLLGKLLARFESELGPAPSHGSLKRETG